MIIAIDPGKHECGLAAVKNGTLDWAGLARCGAGEDMATTAAITLIDNVLVNSTPRFHFALEKPQIYTDNKRIGDQEPLVDLAILLGEVVGILGHSWDFTRTYYMPGQWKGQVPKEIHHRRLKAGLDVVQPNWTQHVAWPPKGLQHNVLDAIGLAFHHNKVLKARADAR